MCSHATEAAPVSSTYRNDCFRNVRRSSSTSPPRRSSFVLVRPWAMGSMAALTLVVVPMIANDHLRMPVRAPGDLPVAGETEPVGLDQGHRSSGALCDFPS